MLRVATDGGKTNSYYEFMLTLMQLMIEGAIDGFIYETDMQKVLGANAYKTFSVEKILHNIFKQVSVFFRMICSSQDCNNDDSHVYFGLHVKLDFFI